MRQLLARLEIRMRHGREQGEGGFSLIELIVVVAILGVLVAIAIPVFGNIQTTAEQNAVKAVAANAATQATAQLAAGQPLTPFKTGDTNITVAYTGTPNPPIAISGVCVRATGPKAFTADSGPGCA